jgi:hypothetical protein
MESYMGLVLFAITLEAMKSDIDEVRKQKLKLFSILPIHGVLYGTRTICHYTGNYEVGH